MELSLTQLVNVKDSGWIVDILHLDCKFASFGELKMYSQLYLPMDIGLSNLIELNYYFIVHVQAVYHFETGMSLIRYGDIRKYIWQTKLLFLIPKRKLMIKKKFLKP